MPAAVLPRRRKRPAVDPNGPATTLALRITPATFGALSALAEAEDRTLSAMARILIEQGLVRRRASIATQANRRGTATP